MIMESSVEDTIKGLIESLHFALVFWPTLLQLSVDSGFGRCVRGASIIAVKLATIEIIKLILVKLEIEREISAIVVNH